MPNDSHEELKHSDLLEAALKDNIINEYDKAAIDQKMMLTKAFIFKDKFKTVVPQLITASSIVLISAGSYFGFMDQTTTISIAACATGSGATLLRKNDELEKQMNKKKL